MSHENKERKHVLIYPLISLQVMMVLDAVVLQMLVIQDGSKPSLHTQALILDCIQYPLNIKANSNEILPVFHCARDNHVPSNLVT